MATLSIGSHLSTTHQFNTRSLCSLSPPPQSLLQSRSSFSPKPLTLRGTRTPGLLGTALLVRAEDKAKSLSSQFEVVPSMYSNFQMPRLLSSLLELLLCFEISKKFKEWILPGKNCDWKLPKIVKWTNQQDSSSGPCDPLCSVDETSSSDFEANYQPKTDLFKAVAVFGAAIIGTVAINHSWVAENQVTHLTSLFSLPCLAFIMRRNIKLVVTHRILQWVYYSA